MKLGAFSLSLSVKDLEKSKDFYEKLGFVQMSGSIESNYLIMKSGSTLIGIFKAMFDGNMLTFNPGWDENAQNLESFDDVRAIQKYLQENEVVLEKEADPNTSGPEHIFLKDPDGNMILIDQHR
nr:VOC family protein [uncultured Chryseobacterium sp.]